MRAQTAMNANRSRALGIHIARLRQERGTTQAELADASGVGLQALRRIEQGRVAQPGMFQIADLAAALGSTVDAMLLSRTTDVTSVGYQGHVIDSFVRAITEAGVDLVADVRLTPVSRKQGFSKSRLGDALNDVGVQYRHLRPLGNAKENRPLFAGVDLEVGRARYRAGLQRPGARAALAELAALARQHRVAILCFEKDAQRCHRSVVLEELAQVG